MGSVPLHRKPQRDRSSLWPCGHREKTAIYESQSGPSSDTESAGSLILDFPASGTVRNKCCLSLSVYGIFVRVAQTDSGKVSQQ